MIYSGTFAETSSPEHQLHWIIENSKVVRSANGLSNIVDALKIASSKHDLLWYAGSPLMCESNLSSPHILNRSLSERQFNITPLEKQEFVEEVNTEMSIYLGMLYLLIEVFKGDDQFGDELSEFLIDLHGCRLLSLHGSYLVSLEPPLPVYLFSLVSALKEKSTKGYPIKKVRV